MAEPQNTSTRTRSHPGVRAGLPFGGRRIRMAASVGLAVVAVLALAACSGDSDAGSVPTVQLEPTASVSSAPTTTTTEAPATTEDPAVAYERDVAEITAVYNEMFAYFETYGIAVNEQALRSTSIDPLLTRRTNHITTWEEQGFITGATVHEIRVIELAIIGDQAMLETCDFGGSELLTADGSQIVIPADIERYLRSTDLRRTEVGWRVADTGYTNGEPTTCDA